MVTLAALARRRRTSANGAVPDELLAEFEVPSARGQRAAGDGAGRGRGREPLGLAAARLERLKTAVAEATMNAMEHGNALPRRPAGHACGCSRRRTRVARADHRPRRRRRPTRDAEVPDLEAKLAGLQRPRGWGLFLIENMVDEMRETSDGGAPHRRARAAPGRRRRWRRVRPRPRSASATGVAVIDLRGDIERRAEAALDAA